MFPHMLYTSAVAAGNHAPSLCATRACVYNYFVKWAVRESGVVAEVLPSEARNPALSDRLT